jgi:hypothetical protein
MHMLLLVGVSVGFALSVLTSNNFYSEKSFTSSVNQWERSRKCNTQNDASPTTQNGGQCSNR